jgi:hypothetical protein
MKKIILIFCSFVVFWGWQADAKQYSVKINSTNIGYSSGNTALNSGVVLVRNKHHNRHRNRHHRSKHHTYVAPHNNSHYSHRRYCVRTHHGVKCYNQPRRHSSPGVFFNFGGGGHNGGHGWNFGIH